MGSKEKDTKQERKRNKKPGGGKNVLIV